MEKRRYPTLLLYAERIETLFKSHNPTVAVSADRIRYNTADTLAVGFDRFCAQGMIQQEDINYLLEKYSFGGKNLCDVNLDDCYEDLEELIRQLTCMNEKYAQTL